MFMDYPVGGGTITRPGVARYYKDYCQYDMYKDSMPQFVIMGFGSIDTMLRNFTEQEFIDSYLAFIKEVEALPTKPLVFLHTPTFQCEHDFQNTGFFPDNAANWVANTGNPCVGGNAVQIKDSVYKVAEKAGIPKNRVMNLWDVLRKEPVHPSFIGGDKIHPTYEGHAALSQVAFEVLSKNPEFLARQKLIANGMDEDYNKGVQF